MSQAAETISDAYRAEQERLHLNPRYGVASIGYAPLVAELLRIGRCRSLADYGAGKCNLKVALGLKDGGEVSYYPYDPAFPAYGPPRSAELVTCIDVLEHIEPDLLDPVLDELASITRRLAVLTIHTGAAIKSLSDGRNAHLIQQPPSWWLKRLATRFEILHLQQVPKGFFVIAGARDEYREMQSQIGLDAISRAANKAGPRRKRVSVRRLLRKLGLAKG